MTPLCGRKSAGPGGGRDGAALDGALAGLAHFA